MSQKILIIGDSFSADWSVKHQDYPGWPNLLAKTNTVVNLSQAGVSEYQIYKQLTSINDLDEFDVVIVAHTSPLRIHTRKHPIHYNSALHSNADLIFADIEFHYKKLKNMFNSSLTTAYNFFIYHYDDEYFETTYQLLRNKINSMLEGKKVIVVSILPNMEKYNTEPTVLNFSELFKKHRGLINHLDEVGNATVFEHITKELL